MFTDKLMILYRGSLKSCNYRCSYCPFSKHRGSAREYERDKKGWERFVESILERNGSGEMGAVMAVPYGEALIHPWYWEGFGRLSAHSAIEAVGAQTNLSFPIEESLKLYKSGGGRPQKLRLWATFHPEMTGPEEFAGRCRQLTEKGVLVCAGAVGVPENLEIIIRLKDLLPAGVYLWINKMDGMKRPYTEQEIRAFRVVDPYFERELTLVKAEPGQCRSRFFVESDGRLRSCNISSAADKNWYDPWEQVMKVRPRCSRKFCSCYLAYGGRQDVMNRIMFGPYPLFRIPERQEALFLDICGTLVSDRGTIAPWTKMNLQIVADQGTRLFFATTLPFEDAMKKCRDIRSFFEGGIFSAGAHILWKEKGEICEKVYSLTRECLPLLESLCHGLHARILTYEAQGILYKITLVRPERNPWKKEEAEALSRLCGENCREDVRIFTEGHCLQAVGAGVSKEAGVRFLCERLGIDPLKAAAAGDSQKDQQMLPPGRVIRAANLRITEQR